MGEADTLIAGLLVAVAVLLLAVVLDFVWNRVRHRRDANRTTI